MCGSASQPASGDDLHSIFWQWRRRKKKVDNEALAFKCGITVHLAKSVKHASTTGVRMFASVKHREQKLILMKVLEALVSLLFEEDIDREFGNVTVREGKVYVKLRKHI